MRRKKNSALGVKYVTGDQITNMEGALHTFVTPISKVLMFGDYMFRAGHGVQRFERKDGKQVAREVLLSAAIQMDFEMDNVTLAVCKLEKEEVVGRELGNGWETFSVYEKRDAGVRGKYDDALRRHMVAHLTQEGRLPARSEVSQHAMDRSRTIGFLETVIFTSTSVSEELVGQFAKVNHGRDIVSLELLFSTAVHQLRNEFSALEIVAPQGYVYTYDPASIFAGEIGADLLNRVMFAALKHLSSENSFKNMRAYGFNDYADKRGLDLAKAALGDQNHVKVVPKGSLFKGPKNTYDPGNIEGGEEAWLVIHNNSDAFGQNIETEGESGSLDGAVGANSSAAASLERKREDLLKYVI
jgi:hypothetical protein